MRRLKLPTRRGFVDDLTSPVMLCALFAVTINELWWWPLLKWWLCPFLAVAFFYIGTILWALGGYQMKRDFIFPAVPPALEPYSRYLEARRELKLQHRAMFGALLGLSGGLWISAIGFQGTTTAQVEPTALYSLDGAVGFFCWAVQLRSTFASEQRRLRLSFEGAMEPVQEADSAELLRGTVAFKQRLEQRRPDAPDEVQRIAEAVDRRDAVLLSLAKTMAASPTGERLPTVAVHPGLNRIGVVLESAIGVVIISFWLACVAAGCVVSFLLLRESAADFGWMKIAHRQPASFLPLAAVSVGFFFFLAWLWRPRFRKR